jgi:hypothetical protein
VDVAATGPLQILLSDGKKTFISIVQPLLPSNPLIMFLAVLWFCRQLGNFHPVGFSQEWWCSFRSLFLIRVSASNLCFFNVTSAIQGVWGGYRQYISNIDIEYKLGGLVIPRYELAIRVGIMSQSFYLWKTNQRREDLLKLACILYGNGTLISPGFLPPGSRLGFFLYWILFVINLESLSWCEFTNWEY